jgi:hypothetical protein
VSSRVRTRATAVFAAVGMVILLGLPVDAANRYDFRLRFRTISTPRFSIHFHQGEDGLARRLARIAEEVASRIDDELGRANGRVHVILVDQTDLSNGWASPAPYNVIEITAAAPAAGSAIGNTDDWLRLVFTHEYTHIVHLDKAHGWIAGLRTVFGRPPVLYPNLFLPLWAIEGIATYNESALTGKGRVPAGDFRVVVDHAAAAGRFEPIDRTNGGLVDWPEGTAHYAYGAYFHQYLADRFGAETIARLGDATAGRAPYLGASSFKSVFGRSLGTLWKEFAATRGGAQPPGATGTRLTFHGFSVRAPVFSAKGRLFYSVVNPHGFPAMMELMGSPDAALGGSPVRAPQPPTGGVEGERFDRNRTRQVTTKFLGGHLAATDRDVVFDQLEVVNDVALQGDLYIVSQDGGRVRRLTHAARAADPDVSPDGRTIVCTIQAADRRSLATLRLAPATGEIAHPAVIISEAGTDFASPRWSPDGGRIVAERRRVGGPSEIVVIDAANAGIRTIVASDVGRNVDPLWTPDGRTVIFASDRSGAPFAIHAVDVVTGAIRRLNGTGAAAQSPALSPDGATLVYVGYTAGGYDLFSIPLASATWTTVASAPPSAVATAPVATEMEGAGHATVYRPWRTLVPQFWQPVLESDSGELTAGAGTAAADALGRHAYAVATTWATSRMRPDWTVAYAYDRWWPTLFASFSDDTDPWRGGLSRTRELNAGALFPIRRVRRTQSVLTAFNASNEAFACQSCAPAVDDTVDRRSLRLGWSFDNTRSYGYSISRETGASIRVTSEMTRRALGSTGVATATTADARLYRSVVPRHAVFASRLAAATASGSEQIRRTFTAAGSDPPPGGFSFGSDAIALMRGFSPAQMTGRHVIVANFDYRFPLVRVQRGAGTLPFFIRTLHAALFADVGEAWSGTFRRAEVRQSFGAELSVDTVLGYILPLTVSGGGAWRTDSGGTRRFVAFSRVGRAF